MNDKTIALNFFQLAPLNENSDPTTRTEQLKQIADVFTQKVTSYLPIELSESRINLYGSIEKRGDYYLGTLVKNQISSIPPSYDDSSLKIAKLPLTDSQGLAYQTSFLYYPPARIVMIEHVKNGVSVKTLCDFIEKNFTVDSIEPLIVINPSKLQEFYNMSYIAKFQMKVSRLENGSIFGANKKTALGKIIDTADETNTNTFEYTLTARRKTGSLKRGKISSLLRSLLKYDEKEVNKLQVVGRQEDEGPNELIDFIEHKLKDRISVQKTRLIESFEVNDHYDKLIAVFNIHRPALTNYKVRNK